MLLSSRSLTHFMRATKLPQISYNTPYAYFASKKHVPVSARRAPPTASPSMKLVFGEDNKALIFEHANGESNLKWLVRGNAVFTIMNSFLFITETVSPVFGGWNYLSFGIGVVMGIAGTVVLNVFSKRTIHKLKLFRTGDYAELTFFNAFWVPKTKVFHISEFSNMLPTFFNFTRSELTSLGKVWINLEKNVYAGLPDYDELTKEVLNGKIVKLAKIDHVLNKYNQYKNK